MCKQSTFLNKFPTQLQFKTQMQVEILRAKTGGTPQYRNVFHAGYVIASHHGVRGVYQGLGATWQRNAPAVGIYFGMHYTEKMIT